MLVLQDSDIVIAVQVEGGTSPPCECDVLGASCLGCAVLLQCMYTYKCTIPLPYTGCWSGSAVQIHENLHSVESLFYLPWIKNLKAPVPLPLHTILYMSSLYTMYMYVCTYYVHAACSISSAGIWRRYGGGPCDLHDAFLRVP